MVVLRDSPTIWETTLSNLSHPKLSKTSHFPSNGEPAGERSVSSWVQSTVPSFSWTSCVRRQLSVGIKILAVTDPLMAILIPLQSCSLRNARKIILHMIITKCNSVATPPAVVVPPGANSLMRSVTAPVGHRWRPPRSLRNFQHPRGTKELFELVQPHRYWTWLNCEDGWRRLRVECRLDHAWAYYIPAIPSMTSCLLI